MSVTKIKNIYLINLVSDEGNKYISNKPCMCRR